MISNKTIFAVILSISCLSGFSQEHGAQAGALSHSLVTKSIAWLSHRKPINKVGMCVCGIILGSYFYNLLQLKRYNHLYKKNHHHESLPPLVVATHDAGTSEVTAMKHYAINLNKTKSVLLYSSLAWLAGTALLEGFKASQEPAIGAILALLLPKKYLYCAASLALAHNSRTGKIMTITV